MKIPPSQMRIFRRESDYRYSSVDWHHIIWRWRLGVESGFAQLGRILAEIALSSQECNTQDEDAPPRQADTQNNCTAIQPRPPSDCYIQAEDDQS